MDVDREDWYSVRLQGRERALMTLCTAVNGVEHTVNDHSNSERKPAVTITWATPF